MKKLLFTLLCAALFAGCSDKKLGDDKGHGGNAKKEIPNDMEKAFPDPIFRAYVLENFDIDSDGKISKEEAEKVTRIEVHKNPYTTSGNEKIASLEGVQYFTNLTYLDCSGNKLTELNVTHNPALIILHCHYNQLTKLVTQNTALTELWCYRNQLTELDVTQNPALTLLVCGENQLTKLDVTQNTALEYLSCHYNQLTKLVTQNPALIELNCSSNQLTELDVTQNTALERLNCEYNQLTILDVSRTNLGNSSTYDYPLDCSPMNGSGLKTLYLKTGWKILGIYPYRDNNHAPANTQILFKD